LLTALATLRRKIPKWNPPRLHSRTHTAGDIAATLPRNAGKEHSYRIRCKNCGGVCRVGWIGMIMPDLVNKENWRNGNLSAKQPPGFLLSLVKKSSSG